MLNSISKNPLKFKSNLSFMFLVTMLVMLASCGDDDTVNPELQFNYNFDSDTEGWTADFADYPNEEGVEDLYQLEFGHAQLPEPLDTQDGALRQSGSNRSDDLFMFIKRKMTGLEPNQTYAVDISIEIATDAATGGVGIGGPPGEAVFIKAGATTIEPMKVLDDTDDHFRMNIDKGNQSIDGSDMKNIGDFSNGTADFVYVLKSLETAAPLSVQTNANGEMWVVIGTDSGLEGITTIYNTISIDLNIAGSL